MTAYSPRRWTAPVRVCLYDRCGDVATGRNLDRLGRGCQPGPANGESNTTRHEPDVMRP